MLIARLRDERGSSLVETLLTLSLVVLVVAIGVQGFAYLQARSIATAAAQDGARAAVSAGAAAGLERSRQVLGAGGGAARDLRASISEQQSGITVTVPLRPGRYRYTFIVDGTWRRDPAAPRALEDDFGQPTSVITIAQR